MIRIVIADDHAMVRTGLSQLLGSFEDLEVVGWRTPRTNDSVLGDLAVRTVPQIVQALIRPTDTLAAALEQLAPGGAWLGRAFGVGLVLWGLWLLM